MKRLFTISAPVVAFCLLALATWTAAQSFPQCSNDLSTLASETQNATFVNQRDQSMLLGKISAAQTKLNAAKFCDAIGKLNDYISKVNQLAASGKINTEPNANGVSAQTLLDDANAAISCIRGLANNAGVNCSY